MTRLLPPVFALGLLLTTACSSSGSSPAATPTPPLQQTTTPAPQPQATATTPQPPAASATLTPTATQAPPASIDIRGDEAFVLWTEQALQLLKAELPGTYTSVLTSIRTIRSVEAGSGMDVFNKVYMVGDETTYAPGFDSAAQLTWYAGTIVHDACHSALYDRGEEFQGKEAELACLAEQLTALEQLSFGFNFTSYIQGLIEGADDPANQYWNNPNRHW